MISELSSSIKNVHKILEYFTEVQQIFLNYVSISMAIFVQKDNVYLVVGALYNANEGSCTNSSVFAMSKDKMSFIKKYQVLF